MKKKLVTVYGSLLEGFGNWRYHLNNSSSVKLGEHLLEGPYKMVSFGGFPGLIVDESLTSKVFVETYEVTEDVYRSIERLEGFHEQDSPHNFYNKRAVETPFGKSEVYIIERSDSDRNLVPIDEDGVINWRKYKTR